MKTRLTLTLLALLPVLAACKADDGSANVTAPAATTPATTEAAPAASAEAAAAAPAAGSEQAAGTEQAAGSEPMAASTPTRLTGPEPVAGTDYVDIPNGQPFQPVAGKVEVVEIFGYVCPACAAFQPLVGPWKAGLPGDVNFIYVPAMFGGTWDDYARAFYAAQTLGVQEKTHEPLYAAIHAEQSLKGERGRDSVDDIAAFYAKHGVDAKQFTATMSSFAVNAKTNAAKQFAQRSQITGTPSLIIDGKYLVKGKTFQDQLRIADHLIARERASRAAH